MQPTGKAIGLDMGLKYFYADSFGHTRDIASAIRILIGLSTVGHTGTYASHHGCYVRGFEFGRYWSLFPPSDPKWAGANSLMLLEQVNQLITAQGWQIGNIDSVIVAERPKLKPHIKIMGDRLAQILNLDSSQVGIKATTNEKLGPVGREEGISAYAVVLLVNDRSVE
ncbi:MAG: 2-C-methyl-D-erythritol 2,4-cyclodiphosphate synthase, partial [Spirulinaceae cyanobacterium]